MEEMKLRDYQQAGMDFMISHPYALMLAPVGAGKTAIAIRAMRATRLSFLVLAPKRVALETWPTEIKKWAPELDYQVLTDVPKKSRTIKARIVIAHYEMIPWLTEHMTPPEGVMFDELTRLKNSQGVRFKDALKLTKNAKIRWGLTGSFTSNGLEDVFGQCRIISPNILGTHKTHFLKDFFVPNPYVRHVWTPKPDALIRIMSKAKPYSFFLEHTEYALSLPPINIVDVSLCMNMVRYNVMRHDMCQQIDTNDVTAGSAVALAAKLQQLASGFVYDDTGKTHWLSNHKLDAARDIIEQNGRSPTIIFYWFKAELTYLLTTFTNAETIDSDDAVGRWNRGQIQLLLLHPSSAGHGLNLQYGGYMAIFFSLPWSHELYEQSIGRLHRGGQSQAVWVYRLLTNNTIDSRLAEALTKKKNLATLAMNELKSGA
jgi:superfamily II DNA or RNA helicase